MFYIILHGLKWSHRVVLLTITHSSYTFTCTYISIHLYIVRVYFWNTIALKSKFVTLQIEFGWRKVKICSTKWLWLSPFLHSLVGWWKTQQSLTPAKEVCNKYDLINTPWFWLANHNDWSRCFAISSLPPICKQSFSFMGGVWKK